MALAKPLAMALLALGLALPAAAGPPAAIAERDPRASRAERSFRDFASGWMRKLARAEAHGRDRALTRGGTSTYRDFGDDFAVELRPTGQPRAPWVGILRYAERTMACNDPAASRCRVAESHTITEIFRFQDGRWVY